MTLDPTTRPDLVDRGEFRPSSPGRRGPARRRNPAFLTDDALSPEAPGSASVFYDAAGQVTGDPSLAAAKAVRTGDSHTFAVKASTTGADRGHFYDPRGMMAKAGDLALENRRGGRAKFEFRDVPEAAFRDYLHYLRRHDATFLRQAERAVLNA